MNRTVLSNGRSEHATTTRQPIRKLIAVLYAQWPFIEATLGWKMEVTPYLPLWIFQMREAVRFVVIHNLLRYLDKGLYCTSYVLIDTCVLGTVNRVSLQLIFRLLPWAFVRYFRKRCPVRVRKPFSKIMISTMRAAYHCLTMKGTVCTTS
jgi:hypothetical protein